MDENDGSGRQDASKIYCEKCDAVFDSRKKYEGHLDQHSGGSSSCGMSGESCPLDAMVGRLARLFRKD